MKSRLAYLLPVLIFVGLLGFFFKGLFLDPKAIPSVLIDKPVPNIDLAALPGRGDTGLKTEHLKGQVSLVNIFGSWCVACVAEHPYLMKIKAEGVVPIMGIDWRDDPAAGMAWLQKHGDPYLRVGADPAPGHASVDFGVTGAPESFIVDKDGRIRYKHVGIIDDRVWKQTLLPIIKELQK
ncbi:MAG: DsbE family thiol:disulfide interchange protein [Alphaproteobacteria bacterium]|nr:DsbE family thiol:disulfide interchange protein [Alphaproteobacteria bacterium]